MIRSFTWDDASALYGIWNSAGVRFGYAPPTEGKFRQLLLEHPDYLPEYTFLLEERGQIRGFINGCPAGSGPVGYISCILLEPDWENRENAEKLISAVEHAFRSLGKTHCAVSFFNPIRLPWVIPGTADHQHNNMPGVPMDQPLYGWMESMGYQMTSQECGMYYDLAHHTTPEWVEEKAARMAQRGYTVENYDPRHHRGLKEMVDSLGNPVWSAEIPAAAEAGLDLLVALKDDVCAGFTGPVYPEETGRGYLSGVAVAKQYERNGLGTLLFYRLLQREREVGSKYMSIFTGIDNPAKRIYLEAGFRVARIFAVMRKEL